MSHPIDDFLDRPKTKGQQCRGCAEHVEMCSPSFCWRCIHVGVPFPGGRYLTLAKYLEMNTDRFGIRGKRRGGHQPKPPSYQGAA